MNKCKIAFVVLTLAVLGTALLVDDLAAQQVSVHEVRALYPEIFQVRRGDFGYYMIVEGLPDDHVLAPFVEESRYYLGYILANSIPFVAGPDEFRRRLDDARELDELVLRTVHAFLRSQGRALADYSDEPLRVLTLEEVARLATRFFYLQQILPDGRTAHRICAGATGYRAEGIERVPEVEAFVYAAYFGGGELQEGLSKAYFAVFDAVRGDETHESSAADLEALRHRAWEKLAKDEQFRSTLRRAYEERRESLPFVISGR